MPWDKPSAELMMLLEGALAAVDCTPRKMFGTIAYFVNGNMYAAVHENRLMLRLSESDRDELIGRHGESIRFEPSPGRVMREYVALPETIWGDSSQMQAWLDRSYAYAASLPAKQPRASKRKR